eukprot:1042521-Heterocapsa_arctica.AAC.1
MSLFALPAWAPPGGSDADRCASSAAGRGPCLHCAPGLPRAAATPSEAPVPLQGVVPVCIARLGSPGRQRRRSRRRSCCRALS